MASRFGTARRAPLVLTATLALLLAACPAEEEPPDEPPIPSPAFGIEDEQVEIAGNAFQPAEITVAAGTPVVWLNTDEHDHTITHGENGEPADDPLIDTIIEPQQEQDLVFDEPGTYSITCTIHPQMNMTVTVEEEGQD